MNEKQRKILKEMKTENEKEKREIIEEEKRKKKQNKDMLYEEKRKIERIEERKIYDRKLELLNDFLKIHKESFDLEMYEYFDNIKVSPWNRNLKICKKHCDEYCIKYCTDEPDFLFIKIKYEKTKSRFSLNV